MLDLLRRDTSNCYLITCCRCAVVQRRRRRKGSKI